MYVWENMDYGKAGSLVHERDPRKFSWGYFASDTLPQSGIGLFCWFESPAELIAFIANIEAQVLTDKEKVKEIKKVLKRIKLNGGLTTDLRKQINSELNDIEIKWWGTFSDLCSGKNKFSREMLNAYFGPLPQHNKPQTVYVPKFIDFCERWGH